MVRLNPVSMSIEEELVALFTSGQPGKKRWFIRKMKDAPEDVQERVWSILESKGYERPEKPKKEEPPAIAIVEPPPRSMIIWSDQEWDRLAQIVWGIRKNDPTDTLVGYCRRAVEQFPQDRRRTIRTTNEIKPLIDRLTLIDKKYSGLEAKMAEMRDSVASLEAKVAESNNKLAGVPTREAVFNSATDDEVEFYFSERVMDMLAPDDVLRRYDHEMLMSYIPAGEMIGSIIKAGLEMFRERDNRLGTAISELTSLIRDQHKPPHVNGSGAKPAHSRPSMPMPRVATPKPLRVTVIGLLGEQQKIVESKLKGRALFNFVDKNHRTADSIPNGQDIIVLAANFISHSTQDQAKKKAAGTHTKVVIHHGGIDMMVRKLDEMLPQVEFVS